MNLKGLSDAKVFIHTMYWRGFDLMQVSTQKTLINQAEHQRKIAHINFLLCLLWYNVEHSDTKEITLNAIVAKDPSARFILIRCTVTSYPTHKEITVEIVVSWQGQIHAWYYVKDHQLTTSWMHRVILHLCIMYFEHGTKPVISDWRSKNITLDTYRIHLLCIKYWMKYCCPLAIKFDKAWIFEMKEKEGRKEGFFRPLKVS